ncbi:MAG: hypothetical protein EXS05_24240 [Planctomycetaceae bacterium]|nr:hypothetical protein [Planctomycetaceae bacterium]
MLRRIWIDEIFEQGQGDGAALAAAFSNDLRVKKAFEDAAEAYLTSQGFHKLHPNVIGMPPQQAARIKFLDELRGA